MRTPLAIGLCLLLPLASLSGCKQQSEEAVTTTITAMPGAGTGASKAGAPITDAARAEAKQLLSSRCAPCHGEGGDGKGPTGVALNPRPRDFHDKAWQAGVTDEGIERIIRSGGGAVGKSPTMPGNPDLIDKPAVVSALRELIRAMGR